MQENVEKDIDEIIAKLELCHNLDREKQVPIVPLLELPVAEDTGVTMSKKVKKKKTSSNSRTESGRQVSPVQNVLITQSSLLDKKPSLDRM